MTRRVYEPLGILLLIGVACFANRLSSLDLTTSHWFFDPQRRTFPLTHHWLWSTVLHSGLKWLAVVCWVALAFLWVRSVLRPSSYMDGKSLRAFLLFTLMASLVSVLVVTVLRNFSGHSCPWSLREFGGTAEFFPLFSTPPDGAGPGRCLPSGHAASGFMWIAAVYGSARWKPGWLVPLCLTVLPIGILAGTVQIARGAHFLSHVILTAALCWLVPWVLSRFWPSKGPQGSK